MKVERLREILPVPEKPVETVLEDKWKRVEESIGTKFPESYKRFIEIYGTGQIGQFLWIFNPFSGNEHLNLLHQVTNQLNAMRILQDTFGVEVPYPLYPETGGLLPFGLTDNGDIFFWITKGHPNEWHILIKESRANLYEEYSLSFVDFLIKIIQGEIDSKIIGHDSIDRERPFRPVT